ncbi:MAG: hypothetical protein ACKN9U_06240 [Pirellulaceae bacterium]
MTSSATLPLGRLPGSGWKKDKTSRAIATGVGSVWIAMLFFSTGCTTGPSKRELTIENQRLTSEYRAQKRELEDLRAENDRLAARLGSSSSRLSARPPITPPTSLSPYRSAAEDPKSLDPSRPWDRGTASGTPPPIQSGPTDRSAASPQWRPLRRP